MKTSGKSPYRVYLYPTPPNLARFARAVFRTGSFVTQTETGPKSTDPWVGILWIPRNLAGVFQSICLPEAFEELPLSAVSEWRG